MKGSVKVRSACALAAVALVTAGFAAQPASADIGTATVAGTGVFDIGLGVSGPPQGFAFNGQGAIATTSVQGEMLCALQGFDNIGTVLQGVGGFNGNCETAAGTVFVNGNFTREGTFMSVSGAAGGAVTGSFSGPCVFSPLPSVNTTPLSAVVDRFAVSCQFVIT